MFIDNIRHNTPLDSSLSAFYYLRILLVYQDANCEHTRTASFAPIDCVNTLNGHINNSDGASFLASICRLVPRLDISTAQHHKQHTRNNVDNPADKKDVRPFVDRILHANNFAN